MIVYLDTSALLKLYLAEPESAEVRRLVQAADLLCTHLITYAEMRAALARAVRLQRLPAEELQRLVAQLDVDWDTLRTTVPDGAMVRRAGVLAERFDLRGYDSVHLAAAEAVFAAAGEAKFLMAVYDGQLAEAARSLGMAVSG